MSRPERQNEVIDILEELKKQKGLEPLKQLFWSELNYNQVNEPLSRHGLSDTANKALAEDPILLASGGSDNGFHIIYSRLASERLLIGQERPIVSKLLQTHPYTLFIFSNNNQERWHFLNVKYDENSSKRRLFRRITIGPEERLRTASERIAMLDLATINPSLFGISPLDIQTRHDEAFDVEAVQKEFFSTFAALYHKVIEDIEQVQSLKDDAGKFAQLLLDRMLFLYFIQKKGWLNQKSDSLYVRFQEHWKRSPDSNSFYTEVLYPLFLSLSNADIKSDSIGSVPFLNGGLFEEDVKQTQIERLNQARLHLKNATFKAIFDDLLEKFNFTIAEDTPLDVEVAIDPEMLGKIFESLILQLEKDPSKDLRKLTGSYYTPRPIVHFMCQEAFKEYLVTQLSGVDKNKAASMKEKVDALVSLPPADHLDDEQIGGLQGLFTNAEAESLAQAIYNCKVCDPAVGSGAFLVGMLHEMITAIAKLDLITKGEDALRQRNYDYDLKKRIIESCLYGVDIQEQAVRLCELRLWLSLVVDYEVDHDKPFDKAIREVPSLPNLSYRVVRGDSLLERLFGHVINLDQMAMDAKTKQIIESIQADKQSYFRESNAGEKHRLELKILAKQADLAERLIAAKTSALTAYQTQLFGEDNITAKERRAKEEHEGQIKELNDLKIKVANAKNAIERITQQKRILVKGDIDTLRRQYFQTGAYPTFIWRVDFAEVFIEKGGFDIVIANPPYVRADSGDVHLAFRKKLEESKIYETLYEKWDLMVPFIERGLKLSKSSGDLIYITSNAICTSKYAFKLLDLIQEKYITHSIDYFDDMAVFEAGVIPVVLHIGKNDAYGKTKKIIHRSSFENIVSKTEIPTNAFKLLGRNAFRKEYNAVSLKAETINLGDICYMSYGLRPNSDERYWKGEFTAKDLVSEKRDKIHSQQYVEGKDLENYFINRIRYLEWNTERVPKKLVRPTFPELYDRSKIMRGRVTGGIYDDTGLLCNDSIVVFVKFVDLHGVNNKSIQVSIKKFNRLSRTELEKHSEKFNLKYLLAVLNSSFAMKYLNNIRRHRLENYFYPDDFRKLPIADISMKEQKPFVELVDKILSITKDDDYLHNPTKQAKVKELEKQIDQMVQQLYCTD
ncbi:MAG: hypothetical protein M1491_05070 [Deltaproteobacteria bacterium]|nr:hypothetical protein [Deltaproteobacteria bacterium]MCL5276731.1 hypothetical protein [Deltaproteobacteria bacterium]